MEHNKPMIAIRPLTGENWHDLESLFGPRGACGGCWCMYWRCTRSQFNQGLGEKNRQDFKALAESGNPVGLLAYSSDNVAGWMALAPRVDYPTLDRSRILKPVDDLPVWSITCFYTSRKHRGQGLTKALLEASKSFVRDHSGNIIEGYPVIPGVGRLAPISAYTGIFEVFQSVGFQEVARRKETRPIMRYYLTPY